MFLNAVAMTQCCEKLGAGEILLNCVDMDGQKDGFDLGLIKVRTITFVHRKTKATTSQFSGRITLGRVDNIACVSFCG